MREIAQNCTRKRPKIALWLGYAPDPAGKLTSHDTPPDLLSRTGRGHRSQLLPSTPLTAVVGRSWTFVGLEGTMDTPWLRPWVCLLILCLAIECHCVCVLEWHASRALLG